MLDELYNMIKNNESKGDFTYVEVTKDMLNEAEKELNLKMPNEKIIMWSQDNSRYTEAYDNFETYLKDRINDILENMWFKKYSKNVDILKLT